MLDILFIMCYSVNISEIAYVNYFLGGQNMTELEIKEKEMIEKIKLLGEYLWKFHTKEFFGEKLTSDEVEEQNALMKLQFRQNEELAEIRRKLMVVA